MTEEIIIDGVNVKDCPHRNLDCSTFMGIIKCYNYGICEGQNCLYKQLKRLEQESQELYKIINCKNGTIASLANVKNKLKEENAKLKELLETRCYNEVEFENKKLKEELAEVNQLKDMYHTYYRAKHDDIKGIIFKQKEKLDKIKGIATKYSQHEGYLLDSLFTNLVDELNRVLKDE